MLRRFLSAMALGLIGCICCGCAHTEMTSFVDPDFRGKTYRRILVRAQYDDLDRRTETEARFLEELGRAGVKGIASTEVLPPTREQGDSEIFDVLAKHDIDAILMVTETDYYEDREYIPPSRTTTASHYFSAQTYYHGRRRTTHSTGRTFARTTTTGGHYVSRPRVRHELTLYDRETKRMGWIATSLTKGDSQAGFEHLIRSLADKATDTLVADGLIEAGG